MSYVNSPENVFRRDIWLAIDRSRSSRAFSTLFQILCRLVFFHRYLHPRQNQTLDLFHSFSPVALISGFYYAAKLALIGSTSIAVMRKVVGATPMGNYVHDTFYIYIAQLPFPSFYSDKFFDPSSNFSNSFINVIASRRLLASNKTNLYYDYDTTLKTFFARTARNYSI